MASSPGGHSRPLPPPPTHSSGDVPMVTLPSETKMPLHSPPSAGGGSEKPPSRAGDRKIRVRGSRIEAGKEELYVHVDNEVITSRYHWYNFIPLNLMEQFSNVANVYFLLVGIFQIIPQLSTTGGIPSMYEPLAFIVLVSALRAASEDYQKHKADNGRNDYRYDVLDGDTLKKTRSGDLRVGMIVQVKQNEMVPADMIFIGSSLAKGHCFIDKSNLNGETTLEVLSSLTQTRSFCQNVSSLATFEANLEWEPPNKRFDSLRAHLSIHNPDGSRTEVPVSGKALLMRETNLRNADYIYGLVVYTGNDTKIQRSNLEGEKPKPKMSRVMRFVQRYLKVMLAIQCGFCIVAAIWCSIWLGIQENSAWYLEDQSTNHNLDGFYAFFSWFILMSQMVPISLIVSSELVKFVQSQFIQWDRSMYYEPIDKPVKCNSSTIHEDLGLVDYVFSDKTGTLTQNRMEFRYALLHPAVGDFGSKETEIARAVKGRQAELEGRRNGEYKAPPPVKWTVLTKSLDPKPEPVQDCCTRSVFSPIWNRPPRAERRSVDHGKKTINAFTEQERLEMLQAVWGQPRSGESQADHQHRQAQLRLYLTHMALSNTVKPYDDKGVLKFQSEAAEETAMVNFAQKMGFLKKQQNPTILEVTQFAPDLASSEKAEEKFMHLATLGFTTERRRVTVVYQRESDGRVLIMSKGQDTVILALLNKQKTPESFKDGLLLNLNELCTNGLRTLVCAHAEQPFSWWEERHKKYAEVVALDESEFSIGHNEKKCTPSKCEKCAQRDFFQSMEEDAELGYLGCMGLEDQLQQLVPECIRDCLRAQIKVWMITGDKLEAAKNIGLACNLIDPDMAPSFKSSDTLEKVVEDFSNSRLIEITGQWSKLAENPEELSRLFDTFDNDHNDRLDAKELAFCLKALKCSVPEDKVRELFDSDSEGVVTKAGFIRLMQTTKLSPFEAVKFDIDEGYKTYNSITDHVAYPVSILINSAAFEVLYPGKASADRKDVPPEELDKLREKFFKLAAECKSVVFAQAQPAMKKKMVTEIQRWRPEAITLAIGDGANDTDMIQAAHIGVGIAGVEGTAATNSADYAIGTFRFLHTLLFVHGFWSYQRISILVNFIFYKASLLAITGYFFGFFSGMSGQEFWNDPDLQFYNVVFTALPVMFVAVFNKELPRDMLQNNPSAFREAKGTYFTAQIFVGWVVRALIHGVVIFFFPYAALAVDNVVASDGLNSDIWVWSSIVFFGVTLTPTFLIVLEMYTLTVLHFLSVLASVLSLFIVCYILSILHTYNSDEYGVIAFWMSRAAPWLCLLLTVTLPLLMELGWRGVLRDIRPSYINILQERLRKHRKERKQEKQRRESEVKVNIPLPSESPEYLRSASSSVVVYEEDEKKWVMTKQGKQFGKTQTLQGDRDVSVSETKREALRSAIIKSMLRFRNLTGSQFTSAAQARFQDHDSPLRQETVRAEMKSRR